MFVHYLGKTELKKYCFLPNAVLLLNLNNVQKHIWLTFSTLWHTFHPTVSFSNCLHQNCLKYGCNALSCLAGLQLYDSAFRTEEELILKSFTKNASAIQGTENKFIYLLHHMHWKIVITIANEMIQKVKISKLRWIHTPVMCARRHNVNSSENQI